MNRPNPFISICLILIFALSAAAQMNSDFIDDSKYPRLSGEPSPNRFFDVVGARAFLMGREAGPMEVWITPFKVASNIRLSFERDDLPAPLSSERTARWIEVRPNETVLSFGHEEFSTEMTIRVAEGMQGVVLNLNVTTRKPMRVVLSFIPELKPMWPAGLGGQNCRWDADNRYYILSESRRRYNFLIGSPAASRAYYTPAHFLSETPNRFEIDVAPGAAEVPIVIAGGEMSRETAIWLYHEVLKRRDRKTVQGVKKGVRQFLSRSQRSFQFDFDAAVEWAHRSLEEGLSHNPGLGTGLVAGYGLSGRSERPGFAWFFGGDLFFNQFALNAAGRSDIAATSLELIRRNQRADGKIMHELSQGAPFINWFGDYPYGFYHLETSPYYIIAVWNTFQHSGDVDFLREFWPSMLTAYEYALTTETDGDGLPENAKGGLGALEVGAFLDELKTDIYVAGLWVQSLTVLEEAAAFLKQPLPATLAPIKAQAERTLREQFFVKDKGYLALGLNVEGKAISELTAWPALPLMFHLLPEEQALPTLRLLNSPEIATDWGMRMLTNRSSVYDPTAYNNGAVWPLLTGYVALAQFAYRRPAAGWHLIESTWPLTFEDSRGDIAEVYSGAYRVKLDEAVDHQLFSSGGLLAAVRRGLWGIRVDAANKTVHFAPQVPMGWRMWEVTIPLTPNGEVEIRINGNFRQKTYTYEFTPSDGAHGWTVHLAPSYPLIAEGIGLDGLTGATKRESRREGESTVVEVEIPLDKSRRVTAEFTRMEWFEIEQMRQSLPGSPSRGVRYLSSRANADGSWNLELAGVNGSAARVTIHTLDDQDSQLIHFEGKAGEVLIRNLTIQGGKIVAGFE